MERIKICPRCKSTQIEQEAVDSGIGNEYWPAYCKSCQWRQRQDEEDIDKLFKEEWGIK
jgi:predicted Zn-ribbon and HTH transcriptional regulator